MFYDDVFFAYFLAQCLNNYDGDDGQELLGFCALATYESPRTMHCCIIQPRDVVCYSHRKTMAAVVGGGKKTCFFLLSLSLWNDLWVVCRRSRNYCLKSLVKTVSFCLIFCCCRQQREPLYPLITTNVCNKRILFIHLFLYCSLCRHTNRCTTIIITVMHREKKSRQIMFIQTTSNYLSWFPILSVNSTSPSPFLYYIYWIKQKSMCVIDHKRRCRRLVTVERCASHIPHKQKQQPVCQTTNRRNSFCSHHLCKPNFFWLMSYTARAFHSTAASHSTDIMEWK